MVSCRTLEIQIQLRFKMKMCSAVDVGGKVENLWKTNSSYITLMVLIKSPKRKGKQAHVAVWHALLFGFSWNIPLHVPSQPIPLKQTAPIAYGRN